jgi:hypothetical protein
MDLLHKRKAHFTEIGPNVKLGREVQDEYERAAETACMRNAPVKITLIITVCPPMEDNIGKVSYEIKTTLPSRKSIEFDAAFDNNKVVATSTSDLSILQESLNFPELEILTPIKKEAVNG